jgi:tripartite-type tricarboxylate transporter receptor subunit TctC
MINLLTRSPMTTALLNRRRFGLMLAAGWSSLRDTGAQPLPGRSLRVLCGYPPGGSVDIVSRKLVEKLAPRIAGPGIVDNKPGAAGRLAVEELRKAAPDGTTVLITPASVVTMYPHVYRQLSYNPFTDLAPVSTVCASGFALAVGPKVPARVTTCEDFSRWCRAEPAAAQCGNAGAGSMPHLMALLMARDLNIELAHIPYRGGYAAMQAAAAGEVAAALSTESSARALQDAGKLRVLATTWSDRSPFFPNCPTFREQGIPALTQREWFGAFVPVKTPASMVQALAEAIRSAMQQADARETCERGGLLVEVNTPMQMLATMRAESEFWAQLVNASGFTPET